MVKTKVLQYLELSALALFIYMPFHIFLSTWLSTYTGGLEEWKLGKDFFTVVVTIVFIVTVVMLKKYTKLYLYLLGFTCLYGLLHIVLLFTTNQPTDTGLLATAYNLRIFAYLLIGYSLTLLIPKTDFVKKFSKVLIVVSTVVCLVALIQWVLPKDLMANFGYSIERGVKPNFFIDDKPDLPRVFSTLRDPNSLGAFLILPIVFLVQKLLQNWKTNKRTFLLGLTTLHVLVLLLTFSRSTLLATLLAVSVLLAYQQRRFIKRHSRKIILLASVCLLLLITSFSFTKDSYVVENLVFHADESTTLDSPNEKRLDLMQRGLEGIANEPLGNGPGTAGLVSTRLPNGLLTENYFLQVAYEVGIFGFIVFVGLILLIVRELWRRKSEQINIVLLASFVGLVFANLLFHTWANEAVSIAWFMLAGLAIGLKSRPAASKPAKRRQRRAESANVH